MLSTNIRKDSISIQNVNSQARLAVLSIASNNIQLFMSTLCLDILTPPTLEHRRSVMQIVAFLIRKVWLIFMFALRLLYNDSWLSAASHPPTHPPKTLGSCYQILGSEFNNKPRCSIRYRHWDHRLCCQDVSQPFNPCSLLSTISSPGSQRLTFIWQLNVLQLVRVREQWWCMIWRQQFVYTSWKGIRSRFPAVASLLTAED